MPASSSKVKTALLLAALLLLVACASRKNPVEPVSRIFAALDQEVKIRNWGNNNDVKAALFENIYFLNYKDEDFLQELHKYLDSQDKCYWIGIFLDDEYYTQIFNYKLAIETLEKGLLLAKSDQEKVRFLWIIGKKFYYNEDKETAGKYLGDAYKLAEEYPGNTPTWDNEQEYNEIMKFIAGL